MVDKPNNMPFCGRETELARLLTAWEHVARDRKGPRVFTVVAESGIGKTRLLQEFYGVLSRVENKEGTTGYWPDVLGIDGNNLRINPPEASHDISHPIPFLWWGLRLVDPLAHNRPAAGVLLSHVERDLIPHLEPVYRECRKREHAVSAARLVGGAALDVIAELVPLVGVAKTITDKADEVLELHRSWNRDRQTQDPRQLVETHRASLVEKVLKDFHTLFSRARDAVVPVIIVIDDAQFSTHDPGLVAFTDQLLTRMTKEQWPVLLVVSHWEREWLAHKVLDTPTIARCIQLQSVAQPHLVEELMLTGIKDLGPVLDAALPGLTKHQRMAVLNRADGNPRFLDEMVRFALSVRGRALFVQRDPTGPFTEEGTKEMLNRSVALHDLIRDRFADMPEQAQKTLVIASCQGHQFIPHLVNEILSAHNKGEEVPAQDLDAIYDQHGFAMPVSGQIMAFAQRIYYEVARENLPALFEPVTVDEATRTVLRAIAYTETYTKAQLEWDDWQFVGALMGEVFADAQDEKDRRIAAHGIYRHLDEALGKGDDHAALVLARRLAAILPTLSDDNLDGDLLWPRSVGHVFRREDLLDEALPHRERVLRMTRATFEEEVDPRSTWMYAQALYEMGQWYDDRDEVDPAWSWYIRAHETLAAYNSHDYGEYEYRKQDDAQAFSIANRLYLRIAEIQEQRGEHEAATSNYEHAGRLGMRVAELSDDVAALHAAACSQSALAEHAVRTGSLAGGIAPLEHAITLGARVLESSDLRIAWEPFILNCIKLSELLTSTEQKARAAELAATAVALARKHCTNSAAIEDQHLLANALANGALAADCEDRLEHAMEMATEAIGILRPHCGEGRGEDLWRTLANALIVAASVARQHKDRDKALAYAREALELNRECIKMRPASPGRSGLLRSIRVLMGLTVPAWDDVPVEALMAEANVIYDTLNDPVKPFASGLMGEMETIIAHVREKRNDLPGASQARQRSADYMADFARIQQAGNGSNPATTGTSKEMIDHGSGPEESTSIS